MSLSVSEDERADAEPIDFWSSHPINWPALYTIGCLMLAVAGVGLWAGEYDIAATSAFIVAGGALLVYGRVRELLGKEAGPWRWAGVGVWGLLGGWNLIQVVRAWLAHGG
jgi:hypothetical protein